jgi:hypothetical protein
MLMKAGTDPPQKAAMTCIYVYPERSLSYPLRMAAALSPALATTPMGSGRL